MRTRRVTGPSRVIAKSDYRVFAFRNDMEGRETDCISTWRWLYEYKFFEIPHS